MKFLLLAGALVLEPDLEASVQVGHLAQVSRDDLVLEFHFGENLGIGRERGPGAAAFGCTALLDLGLGHAALVALVVELAVLADLDFELHAERIHDRRADAVQSARHLVGLAFELAARVQHRMHHFERRALLGRMHVDRDAAAVVRDGDPIVAVDRDVDLAAKPRHRLVDRVVNDLGDEVMQSTLGGVADIHPGALANRLETLENLDRFGPVAVRNFFVCHVEEWLVSSPPCPLTTGSKSSRSGAESKGESTQN